MAYVIQAKYSYYAGTYNAPANGYIREPYTGKPIKFSSKTEAIQFLQRKYGNIGLYEGNSTYAPLGNYREHNGEYSRPRFIIKKA